MKKFALFIAALASCLVMSAQDVKVKSRVELKGGKAAVTGYAELQADGGYVVETESGDIFYYSASEIKKVTVLEENAGQNVKVKKTKTLPDVSSDRSKTRGYMGILEAGLGLNYYDYCDYGDYSTYSEVVPEVSLMFINGYRFSPHFYLGLGIGLSTPASEMSLPIFLHLRSEFTKRRVSPYIALSAGTIIPMEVNEGFFCEAQLGVRSYCKKHGSMWYGLSAGFVSQYGYSWDELDVPICLKIAYSF